MSIFGTVIDALNRTQARYVIVGGFAVTMHGYARFTSDLDIVIDLSPRSASLLIGAITDLGFRPRAPVRPEDFANAEIRRSWVELQGQDVEADAHSAARRTSTLGSTRSRGTSVGQ